MSETQPPRPVFDPEAAHQQQPKLRPVRGFPAQAKTPDGQTVTMLGLADVRQISARVVVTSPAAQHLLPLMDGSRTIAALVEEVGQGLTDDMLQQLVAQLDDAGLLEGPVFDGLLQTMRDEFDAAATLPPGSSADFADALVMQKHGEDASDEQKASEGPVLVKEMMDQWMGEALKSAENPSFDALPKAIVAPHLDYGRGWMNYANAYGRLRVCDRPDRVVILGTNHFGLGTGVVACDKAFESPLGMLPKEDALESHMREALGDALFAHRYDHEREHSIELQLLWIQHVFGSDDDGRFPSVFAALVHDPAPHSGESSDGEGVALEPFVEALKSGLASLGGKTLVVASADLSHVGPMFGDQQQFLGEDEEAAGARQRLVQHDQEMLAHVLENRPHDLVSAMAWQQNPTRWCSVGNLVATLMTVEPERVEMLNYNAAADQQGMGVVTSAAMAIW